MNIIIKNNNGCSIYEQIKEQIKTAIFNEELKEGSVLPSMRKLSRELHISILTTQRAYTELEEEGYIQNIQGKGCYVLGKSNELVKENLLAEIEDNLQKAIEAACKANYDIDKLHQVLEQLWLLKNE